MLEGVRRRRLVLPERGVEIALLDWGGEGPLALAHHGNGFCAATWGVLAEAMRPHLRVVAIDARGHGDSSKPELAAAYGWEEFTHDFLAVAERLCAEDARGRVALGLGNSLGGAIAAYAAAVRPDLFERIALLDPVIPAPELGEEMRRMQADGSDHPGLGLVEAALKRRGVWASRDEAFASYATKPTFETWDPRALRLYVDEGMRDRADGQVELKCPGAVESWIFGSSLTVDLFAVAHRIEAPALILRAAAGHFPRGVFERLAGLIPRAELRDFPAGHLMPMEAPPALSRLLVGFAQTPLS